MGRKRRGWFLRAPPYRLTSMAKSRKPPSTTADPTRERRGDGPITAATVGGRLVASALAATDRADAAEGSVKRADYLAALSRRLSGSLEESSTRETIAQVALPDAWAIVDLAASDGTPVRLAITHPDPEFRRTRRDRRSPKRRRRGVRPERWSRGCSIPRASPRAVARAQRDSRRA